MTAALYGCRAGLSVKLLEGGLPGGQLAESAEVENYPSHKTIAGWELAERIREQTRAAGAELVAAEATAVHLREHTVVTAAETYQGRTLILATGAHRRRLDIPGERELAGHGISWCATCDGAFYRGGEVAVVGGGNTALEEALMLSRLCRTVWLIHRRDRFRAQRHLVDAVAARENIRPLMQTRVTAAEGDGALAALRLESAGETRSLPVQAMFEAVGLVPNTALFAGQLPLDEEGYSTAGEDCATGIPGVWVAGDLRRKPLRQLLTAMADGAVAATAAAASV